MIDATSFPDAEAVLIAALKTALPDALVTSVVTDTTPTVIVGYAGAGGRSWGEASVNVGINVIETTDQLCRNLVATVQNTLATLSDDDIASVTVPAGGGVSIPRQDRLCQRYFAVTANLRATATL